MKAQKSLISLILTNLVPVLGVVFLDWDVHAILVLFWFNQIKGYREKCHPQGADVPLLGMLATR